jgi:anti-anti-sigma factor
MAININKHRGHYTIKLDGDLSIYEVADYHQELVEKLGSATSATIELSQGLEMDTAGIQFLISLQKQFQATGGDLTVQSKGEKSAQVIDVFNLTKQFKFSDGGII